MKPLFPFYGSKWRDARKYPTPRGRVVEPFAGSAGYSTYWEPEKVTLIDKDPYIVGVWDYLIHASARDILALPDLEPGQSTDSLAVAQEARWLIGFWLNRGSASPKKTQTEFSSRTERQQLVWSERARVRMAADVSKVRHWTVIRGDYHDAPRGEHTVFVDPPYMDKGRYYRFGSKGIDYDDLGVWCKNMPGLVIVCEQEGATWLPFDHFNLSKSTKGRSAEVIWTNQDGVDDE